MFRGLVDKPLLSNLKHLALSGVGIDFDSKILNKVNEFSQLLHLEINIYY